MELIIWKYKFTDFKFIKFFLFYFGLLRYNRLVTWFKFFDDFILGYLTKWWKDFEFIGYQFSMRRFRRFLFFEIDLGFTFKILFKYLHGLFFRKKKRRFLFYNIDKFYLNDIINFIEFIHSFPIYKVKGFVFTLKRKKLSYFSESFPVPRKKKILETFFLTAKYKARFF